MATTQSDTTTVRLPRKLVEQMRRIAVAHDRSLSAELRVALAAYVRAHEGDQ
jgi:predicted transcriptional regulator